MKKGKLVLAMLLCSAMLCSCVSRPMTEKNTAPVEEAAVEDISDIDLTKGESFLFEAADGWCNGSMFNVTWRKENVTFENNAMQIVIGKDTKPGTVPYSGGEYRSKEFYGYGRYEVRMKAIKNDGVVSSFFTYTGPSDNNPWDEIDIEILGKDNYFLEIQDHGIADQKRIIPDIIKLSKELGIGIVATNDIHYLTKADAKYQDVLMCIQMEKKVNDPDRMKFETDEFYVKSPEEMAELFSYVPEALTSTVEIANRCDVKFDWGSRHLPKFAVPDNKDAFEYLKELCYEGLEKRYNPVPDELRERLEYEMGVIKNMGFVDYFLIVRDFIHYARTHGVMVGPGRGSAAGSIVSYCLGITSIDPIKYTLIFERFLNPERVSMPDIDIDFAPEGRQKIIDYVVERYGEEQVAQIITFGTMKAKLAIRDVGRALDMPYADVDRVAKLVPFDLKMTIEKAIELNAELRTLYETDPRVHELLDTSKALEGLPRHSSTHAAGVVITSEPIVNYVPLQLNT